jgi:uncharacterized protein YbaR (Trm112 family)
MTGIPAEIRDILACPKCRGTLRDAATASGSALVCDACGLSYPVEEGIPVLLIERATALGAGS